MDFRRREFLVWWEDQPEWGAKSDNARTQLPRRGHSLHSLYQAPVHETELQQRRIYQLRRKLPKRLVELAIFLDRLAEIPLVFGGTSRYSKVWAERCSVPEASNSTPWTRVAADLPIRAGRRRSVPICLHREPFGVRRIRKTGSGRQTSKA